MQTPIELSRVEIMVLAVALAEHRRTGDDDLLWHLYEAVVRYLD